MIRFAVLLLFSVFLGAGCAKGGDAVPLRFEKTVWRVVGPAELGAEIYAPAEDAGALRRPAIVFFHGGGWIGGKPSQYRHHARYFAERGFVAYTVGYRTRTNARARIPDAIQDARAAMRWVRATAGERGVDPNRVVAAGGSAGAHLALSTALFDEFDDAGAYPGVRAEPDALLLLAPPTETRWEQGWPERWRTKASRMRYDATFRGDGDRVCPVVALGGPLPPTIIFHGDRDITVPIAQSKAFIEQAKALESPEVELVVLPGEHHHFLYDRDSALMDACLADGLEFLEANGISARALPQ